MTKPRSGRVVNLMLIGLALALVAVAATVWQGQGGRLWQAHNLTAAIGLFWLPLALAGLTLAMLRRSGRAKANYLLCLVSIGLGLAVVELGLDLTADWAKKRAGDTRSRAEVVYDLRRAGQAAVPVACARHFLGWPDKTGNGLLPLSGLGRARTVHCNEGGWMATYQSDRHGFANPDVLWDGPGIEVALIGDSFVLGDCVKQTDSLAAVVRHTFPRTLALGCRGNGPLTELATLTEYARPLKPPWVVWLYCETNDLVELADELKRPRLTRYFKPGFSQDLIDRRPEIDARIKAWLERRIEEQRPRIDRARQREGLAGRVVRLQAIRNLVGLYFTDRSPAPAKTVAEQTSFQSPSPEVWRGLERVLAQARDRVTGWGGRMVVVYLPDWQRFKGGPGLWRQHDRVTALVKLLGLPLLDLTEPFTAAADPFSLFAGDDERWTHYNPAGYRLVGRAVAQWLIEQGAKPGRIEAE